VAIYKIDHVSMRGLSASVPKDEQSNFNRNLHDCPLEKRERLIKTVGVENVRVSPDKMAFSDYAIAASKSLLTALNWDPKDIDILLVSTTSSDFPIPSTSMSIQNHLGLRSDCMAYDLLLTCTGFSYGLPTISTMLSSGIFQKGLLITGDLATKSLSPYDTPAQSLFGDAVTVTALEYDKNACSQYHHFYTDGSGYDSIMVPQGGSRFKPLNENIPKLIKDNEDGIMRYGYNLKLKGHNIFNFAKNVAASEINHILKETSNGFENIDYFVLHQANKMINDTIRLKLRQKESKFPGSLKNFGNTSQASIPLTIITQLADDLKKNKRKLLTCAFGGGLSCGTGIIEVEKLIIPELVEI